MASLQPWTLHSSLIACSSVASQVSASLLAPFSRVSPRPTVPHTPQPPRINRRFPIRTLLANYSWQLRWSIWSRTSWLWRCSGRRRGAMRLAGAPAGRKEGGVRWQLGLGVECHLDDSLRIEHIALIRVYILFFLPCLLYTSPSPRDLSTSRMPSSA